jgi:nitroreductase
MDPAPIPSADLDAIVDAGLWAPSGSNQQPWHFVVVTDRELIKYFALAVTDRIQDVQGRISSASAQKNFSGYIQYLNFFVNGAAIICVFVEPYRALLERLLSRYAPEISVNTRENASVQSTAAAIQNMLLAAHAGGYAACWTTGPLIAKEEIEAKIKPAGPWELLALVALGQRPAGKPAPSAPRRRDRDAVVSYRR